MPVTPPGHICLQVEGSFVHRLHRFRDQHAMSHCEACISTLGADWGSWVHK